MKEGLFGQVILYLIETLPILEKKNVDISKLYWNIETKSYGSIFPNILEHKGMDILNWHTRKTKTKLCHLRSLKPQYVVGDNFHQLHQLFFKYFKIPSDLEKKAASFELKNSLGIHFRGTDKTTDTKMNTSISKEDFYEIFDSYIKKKPFKSVFLATDEKDVYTFLNTKYPNIEIKLSREFGNQSIFWKHNSNPAKNAKEAMIDMLCLSKCKTVLKVSSALSSFAKLVNPNLEVYRLNALKMFTDIPYFPDAYIPLLTKEDTYSKTCNLILDKIQKNEWSLENQEKFNNFCIKER